MTLFTDFAVLIFTELNTCMTFQHLLDRGGAYVALAEAGK